MLVLVLLTIGACLAFFGWGRLLYAALVRAGFRGATPSGPDQALLGVLLLTWLAVSINFFAPLTEWSGVVVLGAGLVFFAWPGTNKQGNRVFVIAVLACAAYFSFRIVRYQASYDAGLYHVPFIKWMTQHAVPFGLANLEERFGFNSAWLALHAALRLPYVGWTTLSAVEAAVWALGACAVIEGAAFRWRTFPPVQRALAFAIGILLMLFAIRWGARSVGSTDNAPNLFAVLAALFFVETSAHARKSEPRERARALLLLVACSCLAVTGRLSMLPIAVLPLVALLPGPREASDRSAWFAVVSVGSLFVVLWVLRNIVISGCLAFPVAMTCVDGISWGSGSTRAATLSANISDYVAGQLSGEMPELEPHPWVPRFVQELLTNKTSINLIVLLLVGIWAAARLSWTSERARAAGAEVLRSREHLTLVFATLFGLALWIAAAAHVRFSWSFLLLALLPVYGYVLAAVDIEQRMAAIARFLRRKPVAWGLVAICVALVAVRVAQYPAWSLRLPEAELRIVRVGPSEHPIYAPTQSDQCWDAPLPCAPYLRPGLEVDRVAGRLRFKYQ